MKKVRNPYRHTVSKFYILLDMVKISKMVEKKIVAEKKKEKKKCTPKVKPRSAGRGGGGRGGRGGHGSVAQ